MKFRIRPNDQHPGWPTKPDPKDLEAALKAAKDGKERKQAPAKALAATQARAAAAIRHGCQGDNLDWLKMVAELRALVREQATRLDGRKDYTWAWIDSSCPALSEPIEVETHFRYGAWRYYTGNDHRYCYVTVTTLETL